MIVCIHGGQKSKPLANDQNRIKSN